MICLGQKAFHKYNDVKVNWYSLDEVKELSKKKKKKILIDLYTDWCGWCKVMDKNTYLDPEVVKYINSNYYPVKLNAEYKETINFKNKNYSYINTKRGGYNQLALELTGGRLSYPCVVFIDENLNVIQPIQGFQEPKLFLMILKYFGENKYKSTPWSVYEAEYNIKP